MVTRQLNRATNNITEEVLTLLYVLSFHVKFSICLMEQRWSNVNDFAELGFFVFGFFFFFCQIKQTAATTEQDPITKEEPSQNNCHPRPPTAFCL